MLATDPSRNSLRRPIGRPALLLLGVGAFLVTGVFTAATAAYAWPDDPWPPTRTTIVGDVDDFAPGSVTRLDGLGVAGYLVRLDDGTFLAFDRAEPVIGCTLPWRPALQAFRDLCHGFENDITGQPSIENRVRVPMNQFEVRVDRSDTIRVVAPVTPQ